VNKVLCFLFLMFFPFVVFAQCNSSDLSRYKSLASNISNYYEYDGNNFNIVFYNVSDSLNVVDKTHEKTYTSNSTIGEFMVSDIKPGSTVSFGVYPKSGDCSDYRVLTTYVTVPYFNKYYSDPICDNNGNSLCSKWVNTSMYSYDQFVNIVKTTKQEEVIEEPLPEVEIHKYGFFDFLGDFYIYILLFIIVSGSTAIYFLDKKSKFDFSLR